MIKSFYLVAACLLLAGCEKRLGEGVTLTGIEAGEAVRVNLGTYEKAKAYPIPWDCTDYEFSWSSADPSIASVDNYGRVTGNDVGNTVLYVSQGSFKVEIPVEVYEITLAEKLSAIGVKGLWQFMDADNLFKASIGPDLIPVGSGFTQVDGPTKRTKAVSLPSSQKIDDTWHHNHLIYNHGFAANGGGKKVNEFTVVIDCKFPGGPTSDGATWTNGKYYCLYQTALDNTTDGDFFWRPSANFGITGSYSKTDHLFVKDKWYRFVISVQLGKELKYFINGQKQEANGTGELDGDRAWQLAGVLLFADEDGENGQGFPFIVSCLATFDRALSDDECRALGSL